MGNKDKPTSKSGGKARLQLKGRIYMANVTDIVVLSKPGTGASALSFDLFYR